MEYPSYIYFNPTSGNVSDTEAPGYVAYINATDVSKREETTVPQEEYILTTQYLTTKLNIEHLIAKMFCALWINAVVLIIGLFVSMFLGWAVAAGCAVSWLLLSFLVYTEDMKRIHKMLVPKTGIVTESQSADSPIEKEGAETDPK